MSYYHVALINNKGVYQIIKDLTDEESVIENVLIPVFNAQVNDDVNSDWIVNQYIESKNFKSIQVIETKNSFDLEYDKIFNENNSSVIQCDENILFQCGVSGVNNITTSISNCAHRRIKKRTAESTQEIWDANML